MTELALDCGAATHTGLVREHNEDRYWMDPALGAFLVVDGVGGQAAGERAAEIAVAAVGHALACQPADGPATPEALVRQAAPERMLWGRSVSRQEKYRILVVDGGNMIAFTLATVRCSAGFSVSPFTQPVPPENS